MTADGSLSAQFEHTVVVTETGVEVLTLGAREASRLSTRAMPERAEGLRAAGS